MQDHPIRVYADASVYGGVFDEEFAEPSRAFFARVRAGRFHLVVSNIVREELIDAPETVRRVFEEMRQTAEIADVTDQVVRLHHAYLEAAILGAKWRADALHVALATVAQCQLIVSWNFRHIVNYRRIPLYNGVNVAQGYGVLGIHSPQEVIVDEDEGL